MENALIIIRSLFAYGFGLFLACSYAGIEWRKRTFKAVGFFTVFEFVLFVIMSALLGADKITFIYPLLAHVPMMFFIGFFGETKPEKAIASVLTAYLCCEFPNWMGRIISALFGGNDATDVIAYALSTIVLAFLFYKYVIDHLSSLLSYSRMVCVAFSLIPFAYFIWSYVMANYPEFITRYSYHATLTASVLFALMFIVFAVILHKRQEDENALKDLEKKRKEEETEKLIAIASNKSKDEFLAAISHEIRTPINAILGFDEIVLRESTEQEVKEYAAKIKVAGLNLLNIINDVLDWSKIESGKAEIVDGEYSTAQLLADVLLMTEPRALAKNLRLNYEIDPGLPRKLRGDNVHIKQIMMNLLTNAVKYTDEGSVTLRVAIKKRDGNRVKIHVSVMDTGIGIKEEDKDKLFNSFERVDIDRNRSVEGTGLGLSIAVSLLKMMHSDLRLDSKYGVGSDFYFDVEQEIVESEGIGLLNIKDAALEQVSVYRESFKAPKAKILIVDDNDMNLIVFKGLMKNTGMTMDTALSGQEAINKIKNTRYDIVFMDHLMPKMSGEECLRRIIKDKALSKNAEIVIVVTANAIPGAREGYIKAGFSDFLRKPIVGYEIEEMIKKYLPADKIETFEVEMPVAPIDKSIKPESSEAAHIADAVTHMSAADANELDVKVGLSYCGGNKELYSQMCRAFIDSDFAGNLERLLNENNIEEYRVMVHGLKSGAKSIGAKMLSEDARESELAIKGDNSDWEFVKKNHPKLIEKIHQIEEKINA